MVEDLGPVAPSMVSVNHGLRGHGIEPCTFMVVNAGCKNHATSN